MADVFDIAGRINSTSNEHVVTTADQIKDEDKNKKQSQINAETISELATHESRLNAYTEGKFVTVDTYSGLPATGAVDTVYRVSSWDGTANSGQGAVDVTKYSEYAWENGAYKFLDVKTQIGEVFDISEYNNDTYIDLADALSGTNVPQAVKRGGMTVKYVCSSDNKYVQYRYMGTAVTGNPNPFLDEANWQGVDDEPAAGSDNLVKSGGVYGELKRKQIPFAILRLGFYDDCVPVISSSGDFTFTIPSGTMAVSVLTDTVYTFDSDTVFTRSVPYNQLYFVWNTTNNTQRVILNTLEAARPFMLEEGEILIALVDTVRRIVLDGGFNSYYKGDELIYLKNTPRKWFTSLLYNTYVPEYAYLRGNGVLVEANPVINNNSFTIPQGYQLLKHSSNTAYTFSQNVVFNKAGFNMEYLVFNTSTGNGRVISVSEELKLAEDECLIAKVYWPTNLVMEAGFNYYISGTKPVCLRNSSAEIDNTPTKDSNNPVKSGGVYLAGLHDYYPKFIEVAHTKREINATYSILRNIVTLSQTVYDGTTENWVSYMAIENPYKQSKGKIHIVANGKVLVSFANYGTGTKQNIYSDVVNGYLDLEVPLNSTYDTINIALWGGVNSCTIIFYSNNSADYAYPKLDNFYDVDFGIKDNIPQYPGLCSIFRKVAFIGSSSSSGEVYRPVEGGSPLGLDSYYYSWGQMMCRTIGCKGANYSQGGLTVKTWVETFITNNSAAKYDSDNNPVIMSDYKPDTVFLFLGINDSVPNTQRTVPLGTVSDIGTDNETFYGLYSKIINFLHSINGSIKIFVCTVQAFRNGGTPGDTNNPGYAEALGYNNAIRYFAANFDNVFLLETRTLDDYWYSFLENFWYNGHFTTLGYYYESQYYIKLITNFIKNNYDSFKYMALINTTSDNGNL